MRHFYFSFLLLSLSWASSSIPKQYIDSEKGNYYVSLNENDFETSFVSTWAIPIGVFELPLKDYTNITINWGDGGPTSTHNDTTFPTHTYSSSGTYTITVAVNDASTKDIGEMYMNNNRPSRTLIRTIENWGEGKWENFSGAFYGATNLTIPATDEPDLSLVTQMDKAFWDCESLVGLTLNDWNVSTVTNMRRMFLEADIFNGDISSWNTAEVTNMYEMFSEAKAFNQDIKRDGDSWNTGNVTDMTNMFYKATAFNGNISNWDTSSAILMGRVFGDCGVFDQDISSWDVSKVTTMQSLFSEAKAFNQDIGSWNTASVTNMQEMFSKATSFNQDISNWNTAAVTNMSGMFYGAYAFNQDINTSGSKWNTAAVTNMSGMFNNAIAFNGNISDWDTGKVTLMNGMFSYNSYDCKGAPRSGDWCYGAEAFNGDITSWNTSNVTHMQNMFRGALAFNRDINTSGDSWNTSKVIYMWGMFANATAFNGNITGWDVSSVSRMEYMFLNAPAFDQNITSWNTASVTRMRGMFANATAFNRDINTSGDSWNTGNVTDMRDMFNGAVAFDQDLNNWDTSKVLNMWDMFKGATVFDGNISNWNTAAVTTMFGMFNNARAFNQDISSWNTALVNRTTFMFNGAISFNQPLVHNGDTWNLKSCIAMYMMFSGATAFTTENYDIFLYSQANNPDIQTDTLNGSFDASSKYCDQVSRDFLTDTKGWTINDNGLDNCFPFVSTWAISSSTFELPLQSYTNITIDWGDGGSTSSHTGGAFPTHSYTSAGTYTITVKLNDDGKDIGRMFMNGVHPSQTLIQTIENWGDAKWESFQLAFKGAINLTIPATDEPDLSSTTDMSGAFIDCLSLVGTTLNDWNTAAVTNMSYMFSGSYNFNGDISSWNTSLVSDMSWMFDNANAFNKNIGSWDTAAVTNMEGLFASADIFNQDIGSWNTAAVTNMNSMFAYAPAFNQPLTSSGNSWKTTAVTNMSYMFAGATAFNKDIGSWDTAAVTNMSYMFRRASVFNQDIGSWNTAEVTNMQQMFYAASAFNKDITKSGDSWNTVKVNNMESLFLQASAFNKDLDSWDTAAVTNMSYMFAGATAFNKDIGSWNTAAVTNMSNMFTGATAFNQPLNHSGNSWNLGNVTNMNEMFNGAALSTVNYDVFLYSQANNSAINSNITITVSSEFCDQVSRDFLDATKGWTINDNDLGNYCIPDFVSTWAISSGSFELPLQGYADITIDWGDGGSTSSHTDGAFPTHTYISTGTYTIIVSVNDAGKDIGSMFTNGHASRTLIQTIENWGEGKWGIWNNAFRDSTNLTIPATDEPDLSLTNDMTDAFRGCTSLVGINLNDWNTAAVTNTSSMFSGASAFNGNISSWNTALVTDMNEMFSGSAGFNQDIGSWNTAKVTNMSGMFGGASVFNQDISSWNTALVTDMNKMFYGSAAFNQDIGSWNTAAVTNMSSMFSGASVFNQDISFWNTALVTDMNKMFYGSAAFNQDINTSGNSWNTAAVTNMSNMFTGATAFNKGIGAWNTAAVTNMSYMFTGATAFNQPLNHSGNSWNLGNVTNMNEMFNGAALSTVNYDVFLYSQANNSAINSNITITVSSKYCDQVSRDFLDVTKGWVISDLGTALKIIITSSTNVVSDGSTTNDPSIELTFTTSEPTLDFVVGDITVVNGVLSAFTGSGTTYTATFTPTGQGACTIGITSKQFNENCATTQFNWTFDSTATRVTGVTSTKEDGAYTIGEVIPIIVSFNEVVNVTGTPALTLETGEIDSVLSYSSGTGTNTLIFNYTVASGHTSSDLDYQSTNSLTLNSGTIRDAALNDANLTLALVGDVNSLAINKDIVIDTTAPTITIESSTVGVSNGSITTDSSIELTFTTSEPTLDFVVGDITVVNGVLSAFTGSGTTYTATFTAIGQGTCNIHVSANKFTDAASNNNTSTTQFNWTSDTDTPVITLVGSDTVSIAQGATYTDLGATATDNVDGDLTANIIVTGTVDTNTVGTYTVTYNVSDAAGNTATPVVRTVTVTDSQPPVITLVGSDTVSIAQGATYTDLGATATDNVDGDLTANIIVTGTVDTNTVGTYTVTYNVSDAAGNQASQLIRIVACLGLDIYPNPTVSNLTIKSSDNMKYVVLFNLSGEKVMKQIVNDKEVNIDITKLNKGVYLLNMQNNQNEIFVFKIIKN